MPKLKNVALAGALLAVALSLDSVRAAQGKPAADGGTAGLAPFLEPQLSAGDQRRLNEAVAKYFQARREGKDSQELDARGELDKLVRDFESKDRGRRPMLAFVTDLEAALKQSARYRDQDVRNKGRIAAEVYKDGGADIAYASHAPGRYSARNSYPLILALPDVGEKPDEHLRLHWTSQAVREGAILVAIEMPRDEALLTEMGTPENPGGIRRTYSVLADVLRRVSVDPDRIFLVGRGKGVEVAIALANRAPDRWAGVVGRSGEPGAVAPTNFMHLSTLFAGGGEQATAFVDKAKELGYGDIASDPAADEAAIWTWMSSRTRARHPHRIVLLPATEGTARAHWLQAVGVEPRENPRVDAAIDRDANTIRITAENVRQLRLRFNDHLVDLSRPVRIVINGVEHENSLQRSYMTMLQLAFVSGDLARAYTAERTYEVREAPRPE